MFISGGFAVYTPYHTRSFVPRSTTPLPHFPSASVSFLSRTAFCLRAYLLHPIPRPRNCAFLFASPIIICPRKTMTNAMKSDPHPSILPSLPRFVFSLIILSNGTRGVLLLVFLGCLYVHWYHSHVYIFVFMTSLYICSFIDWLKSL